MKKPRIIEVHEFPIDYEALRIKNDFEAKLQSKKEAKKKANQNRTTQYMRRDHPLYDWYHPCEFEIFPTPQKWGFRNNFSLVELSKEMNIDTFYKGIEGKGQVLCYRRDFLFLIEKLGIQFFMERLWSERRMMEHPLVYCRSDFHDLVEILSRMNKGWDEGDPMKYDLTSSRTVRDVVPMRLSLAYTSLREMDGYGIPEEELPHYNDYSKPKQAMWTPVTRVVPCPKGKYSDEARYKSAAHTLRKLHDQWTIDTYGGRVAGQPTEYAYTNVQKKRVSGSRPTVYRKEIAHLLWYPGVSDGGRKAVQYRTGYLRDLENIAAIEGLYKPHIYGAFAPWRLRDPTGWAEYTFGRAYEYEANWPVGEELLDLVELLPMDFNVRGKFIHPHTGEEIIPRPDKPAWKDDVLDDDFVKYDPKCAGFVVEMAELNGYL